MGEKPAEPTQETQPAKGEPVTIPVPEKADVLAALRKVAKASKREEGSTKVDPS